MCNRKTDKLISLFFVFTFLLVLGCQHEQENGDSEARQTVERDIDFSLLGESQSGIFFRNDITETKEVHGLTWDAIYYGGGVGVGDFDNDGLEDIFFAGNQVNDALYLNEGDMTFKDVSSSSGITQGAGWSTGVSIVDINADGFLDIYVCRTSWKKDDVDNDFRANKLFINNGDLTFSEQSEAYGLDDAGYSTQAAFMDFDKDGDLDLFLLNSPSNNLSQKIVYADVNQFPKFTSDKFYKNENGKFIDKTSEVGVGAFSFGLGVIAADLNHDTYVDIYVANDYERPDYMYINQRDGTFKNQLDEKIKHTSFTSMGCDAADINNDGLVDIGVLDMQAADHVRSKTNMPTMDIQQFWSYVNKGYNYQYMSNVLQLNNGFGFFSDVAHYAGVASTDWSWSILMADFNNDTWKDIFVSNGINRDLRNNDFAVKMEALNTSNETIDLFALSQDIPSTPTENYMFKSDGKSRFQNVASSSGLDQKTFSFGAAYADFDRDGDLDLIVNNNNERAFLYKNGKTSNKNNYISARIKGYKKNPRGIGSKVFLFSGDKIQYQELNPVRGFQSSSTYDLHFGLGNASKIDSIVCIFPDDKSIRLYNVSPSKQITFDYAQAKKQPMNIYRFNKNEFKNISSTGGINFTHTENAYDDFKEEILLPHSLSTRGPYQTVGDVNGDRLDDVFIGGANGQSGELFIQQSNGTFKKVDGPWSRHEAQEDMGCALFDADGDGDLDLYVASGGNASDNPHAYHDRLYLNDGKAVFQYAKDALPELHANSSCVEVADFDGDGDMDLFIGGLVEYGRYPYPGQSALLKNENGRFVNVIKEVAPALEKIGMVTDAVWTDVNGDDKLDLMVVGEWMAPSLFMNRSSSFEQDQNFLNDAENYTGWYLHVNAKDLNGDGRPDFVLGNFGENNKFHPSVEKPLKVYSSDFDGNKTNDIVLAKNYKGKYVPVRGRECSSEQMPFIAEKFETFSEFANASIENILEEEINTSLNLSVHSFASGILMSGRASYSFKELPVDVQFFPMMSSIIHDFNKDGIQDIVLVGNLFEAEVETTRHDAGNGLYLQGQGDGEFDAQTFLNSGLYAPLNSRSLGFLKNNAKPGQKIVIGSSNNQTLVYKTL